jgi:hypothetical protein
MSMRFALSDHGQVFSTRSRGATLLALLEQSVDDVGAVQVDFAGVRNISYSFADEFVGELLERASTGRYPCPIVLLNTNTESERVIADSLRRRRLDSTTWLGEASAAPA